MIPQPNQYVILVLRDSGIRLDGCVVEWDEAQITLVSKSKSITTVIPNIDDVLYYQIIEVEMQYEAAKTKPIKTPEDIKAIADLRIEMNNIEKEELARKFSTHEISGNPKLSHYALPNLANIKIPGTPQHTTAQVRRSHTSFDKGLQGVFGKK
jgi:hypothetical protein